VWFVSCEVLDARCNFRVAISLFDLINICFRWSRFQSSANQEGISFEQFVKLDDDDKFSDAQWQVCSSFFSVADGA
jgi:hypothetical protein